MAVGYLHGGPTALFPLAIVWVSAGLDPVRAMKLALHPPPNGAMEFPDGSPSYEKLILAAHPQIAAFGGMFLLMLFLEFVYHDRDIKWLKWIEGPFARIGRLGQIPVMVAGVALILIGMHLTHSGDARATVMTAGVLGLVTYLVVNGLSRAVRPSNMEEGSAGQLPEATGAVGKAGFTLFLYLEVLDATFSFDGVTGAFAITSDPWAIGALAVIVLLSIDHRFQIPEWITASVGVVFVVAAFSESVWRNRRAARAG